MSKLRIPYKLASLPAVGAAHLTACYQAIHDALAALTEDNFVEKARIPNGRKVARYSTVLLSGPLRTTKNGNPQANIPGGIIDAKITIPALLDGAELVAWGMSSLDCSDGYGIAVGTYAITGRIIFNPANEADLASQVVIDTAPQKTYSLLSDGVIAYRTITPRAMHAQESIIGVMESPGFGTPAMPRGVRLDLWLRIAHVG